MCFKDCLLQNRTLTSTCILNICACALKYKYVHLETSTKIMEFSVVLFTPNFQSVLAKLMKASFKIYRPGGIEEFIECWSTNLNWKGVDNVI